MGNPAGIAHYPVRLPNFCALNWPLEKKKPSASVLVTVGESGAGSEDSRGWKMRRNPGQGCGE